MHLSVLLKEKTNAKIIWYLRESRRKYSDILKHLKERDSGKINYHLKKLLAASLIVKKNDYYSLTKIGVKYALYVDSLQLKEQYPLPVVLIAVKRGKQLLLAKRCREPGKGYWGLPGNEILFGETPIKAARKEVKTELGLNISNCQLYGSYPTICKTSEGVLYHVIFLAVRAKVESIPKTGPAKGKISEYRLCTKEELKQVKILPSNKQAILDAFSSQNKINMQDCLL